MMINEMRFVLLQQTLFSMTLRTIRQMGSSQSSDPNSGTAVLPERVTRVEVLPPYNLVLHNDPHHSFGFVVGVLGKVFGHPAEKAFQLAKEAHEKDRAIVWSGGRELGELKLEQMQTFHEGKLGPLGCHLEPGC